VTRQEIRRKILILRLKLLYVRIRYFCRMTALHLSFLRLKIRRKLAMIRLQFLYRLRLVKRAFLRL
jgi:hypothetical protein